MKKIPKKPDKIPPQKKSKNLKKSKNSKKSKKSKKNEKKSKKIEKIQKKPKKIQKIHKKTKKSKNWQKWSKNPKIWKDLKKSKKIIFFWIFFFFIFFFLDFLNFFFKDKSCNRFKFVSVLLSASVERVGVSRMRDFFYIKLMFRVNMSFENIFALKNTKLIFLYKDNIFQIHQYSPYLDTLFDFGLHFLKKF